MLNEVRFQEEEQRLPERHQQHGLAGAAAGFLAFPTREGRAGWSARQDHSRDGGGGWQGWAPAHPAGVSPGVVGWKGMTPELAEQAGSAQGGFGSCCSGEETDLTETSLRGSCGRDRGPCTSSLLHPCRAVPLPTASVHSSPVLAWSAHPEGTAPSSASARLFLLKTCFLQSNFPNLTWLTSGLEGRPTAAVVTQCAGREMVPMEYLGC